MVCIEVHRSPYGRCLHATDPLPKHLLGTPLRVRYEVSRFATRCDIPIDSIKLPDDFDSYNKLWYHLGRFAKTRGVMPPARTELETWLEAGRGFEKVVLTADLHICTKKGGPLFEVQFKPMKTEKSSRLFRRFGNDRFLVIGIPALEESSFPKHYSKSWQALRQRTIDWLVREDHLYFGRVWRAFFVKAKSEKKKKAVATQHGEIRHLVYFFATNGCDFKRSEQRVSCKGESISGHTPMTISNLWDWFCPRKHNKHQTYCKLFSRMALGVSKTDPTVVFHPSEIRRIRDSFAETGEKHNRTVMNDGCSRLSRNAALAISQMLGIHLPSAFQGRIGDIGSTIHGSK